MSNNVFYRFLYRLLKSFYRFLFFFFFYGFSPGPGSSVWAHSAFTHPVCFISFNLEPYLGLSLSPVSLSFLEGTSHLFYRLSSFECVCCFLMVRFRLRIVVRYNTERRQLLPNGNGVTDIGGAEGTGWIVWCWVEMKDIRKNWRAGKQRSMCVWCVCMCVCVCVCVCVVGAGVFSRLEIGPGNSSIPAAVSTPGANSWFLCTVSYWRSQAGILGDWDGVITGPRKVRWAGNIWCQKIRQCLKMKWLSLAKYEMRFFFFWLCWVFFATHRLSVAACSLSLVAAGGAAF